MCVCGGGGGGVGVQWAVPSFLSVSYMAENMDINDTGRVDDDEKIRPTTNAQTAEANPAA